MKHPTDTVSSVARRRWRGSDEQEAVLARLASKSEEYRAVTEKAHALEEQMWADAQKARDLAIPDTVICQRGDISRTTLQRRLGYRAEADVEVTDE
jgi:hypothetical protein